MLPVIAKDALVYQIMFLFNRLSLAFVAASALFGVALLSNAPAAHAQTFNENFNTTANGADPTTFIDQTNTWSVVNPTGTAGTYQSALLSNSFATINSPGFTSLANATLSFDLLNASDSGAVLRWNGSGATATGIVLIVRPNASTPGNDLYFAQVTGGVIVNPQFGTQSLFGTGIVTGGNYRVTFSSYSSGGGDIFNASVVDLANSANSASTTYTFSPGTAPTAGRGGLYQSNTGDPVNGLASQFDNVTLQETPEPNTFLLALPALTGVGAVVVRRRRRSK